jgi:hypothetical protein
VLAHVMAMLAEDYAGLRGGMPDLLLWRAGVASRGAAKVVEVRYRSMHPSTECSVENGSCDR